MTNAELQKLLRKYPPQKEVNVELHPYGRGEIISVDVGEELYTLNKAITIVARTE